MNPADQITQLYGNKLRVRVCGICLDDGNRILMVKHTGLGREGELWTPPGGGMEWGQSAPDNLEREFREETGLIVSAGEFLFIHEHLTGPLHAVELFFRVRQTGGSLKTGHDPEMHPDHQIIADVRFFHFDELKQLAPGKIHAMFAHYNTQDALINASGYFKFEK